MSSQPTPSKPAANPTFLIGAERSGTTLFRLMVDSHPDITCIEGLDYVINAVREDGTFPSLSEFETWLETETVYSTSGFTVDHGLSDLRAVGNDFIAQRLEAAGKRQAAVLAHTKLETILHLWPNASFIHIVRDPRAVALSAKAFEWGAAVYFGVARWAELMDEWDQLTASLPADRLMEIRFEDLVTDHEAVLGRVCAFLGRRYDEEMLSYAMETDYDLPIPAKATEWRSVITDREMQEIEARVGQRLEAKGYESSTLEAIDVGASDIAKMRARVRVLKWKHKLGFFGPAGIGELVARKAGLNNLQVKLKKKMNAKERKARKRSWREPGREFAYSPAKRRELEAAKQD